ncbi:MAG: hypothetical protein EZS28_031766 [Streblomastix strix]|uniref:Uncharacterized protein n=1 Tax=Streblomastix strix TaxID=222440 RepID=A0A5J4UQQ3_9EUKA|nr:MAG: hypothetical protein EZS28_031766 [Streblomastix strix]
MLLYVFVHNIFISRDGMEIVQYASAEKYLQLTEDQLNGLTYRVLLSGPETVTIANQRKSVYGNDILEQQSSSDIPYKVGTELDPSDQMIKGLINATNMLKKMQKVKEQKMNQKKKVQEQTSKFKSQPIQQPLTHPPIDLSECKHPMQLALSRLNFNKLSNSISLLRSTINVVTPLNRRMKRSGQESPSPIKIIAPLDFLFESEP